MLKHITREALKGMIDRNENFILVDVLRPESYEEEHIPGSINIPLEDIGEKAKKHLDSDKEIIVYCGSFQCNMSSQAAEELIKLGYKDVYDYDGGLQDWKDAGFPLESSRYAKAVG
ncbi:MAG: rhodanese-like domain-containing protein [Candidatus Scalinduaceae bacterium]